MSLMDVVVCTHAENNMLQILPKGVRRHTYGQTTKLDCDYKAGIIWTGSYDTL